MAQTYTEQEVKKILDSYRNETHPLVQLIAYELSGRTPHIAAVSERFAFMNSFSRQQTGTVVQGEWNELFFMCEEFLQYGGGTVPKKYQGRPFFHASLDLILGMEKKPFTMITFDEESKNYALSQAKNSTQADEGFVVIGQNTSYLLFEAEKLQEGMSFESFQLTPDGTGLVYTPKGPTKTVKGSSTLYNFFKSLFK